MDEYLGIVKIFAGTFAPRGWAFCQGQLLGIQQNAALFSLLGTTYGGNGQTTFGLPDLRGRIPVGQGQGAGLPNVVIGEVAGTPTMTLTIANMPAHNHPVTGTVQAIVNDNPANTDSPAGTYMAQPSTNIYNSAAGVDTGGDMKVTLTTGVIGSNTAFSIASPYLGVNYIICLQGLFPSRD
jgi:microcystin-dependent protein